MIKYKLICKKCKISFDSWFASSQEYEKLRKRKFLSCLHCNSKKVEKTLMAPKLINKFSNKKNDSINPNLKMINNKIKEYQKFVKDNFKDVGENFVHEARSIHYNNKNKAKGIYGTASNEEIKELREEGIETETIPWIENKSN